MGKKLFVTFYGGVGTVTGANFLLEEENTVSGAVKILVDCGLFQGEHFAEDMNRLPFPYNPKDVNFLLITHAHADHIGRIPRLVKEGFSGRIYSTPETKRLAEVMFDDMVVLLDKDARENGVLPLYDRNDVSKAVSLWEGIPYHTDFALTDRFSLFLKDAGHILGSSMYEITYNGKKIVFTGDLGNTPTPLLRDTESVAGATYLIMESVYGDRNHEKIDERRMKLKKVIDGVVRKKGTLVIPAFSMERTQVLLHEINHLVESGVLTALPVFLDSPLAIRVTGIYREMAHDFNDQVRAEIKAGDDIFSFPRLKFTLHTNDSRAIQSTPNPKIIIAGSGMSEGGRVVTHEKKYINDPNSTILLVGYQSQGTLGRELSNGAKKVTIDGEHYPVRATIGSIQGYSSHKDSDHLIAFVEDAREGLKKVFTVMGEPKASLFLVQRLRDYVGVDALYPEKGKRYELLF
ncbi:MAG: hypothetical protein A3D56_00375 [Candidatus Taylorbacteria bacterium RIFCSPHIGHO2_02_FULL_45_35]|uniref:MBL fold hydrolase n=1 Tax=Candidatus Taylorbacteria bacterium RIFCSPHIGHO2_02_FULL_45_35 TaxID=1802311 RepID=A0A1G2MTP4_9BACT|nr:MAG: hypothetical protein A3D56_00375 [Candidatus Taylorbacteria bacterium RIFCSPHIGHO2_02_FULL_45_35]